MISTLLFDRLIVKSDIQKRLYDSIRTSLELGEGVVMVARKKKGKWEDMVFSEHYPARVAELATKNLLPECFPSTARTVRAGNVKDLV